MIELSYILDLTIKWLIPFILGAVISFLKAKLEKEKDKNKKADEKETLIENAVQSLLRDRLIEKYREYKAKGEMTILDKENIQALYGEYIKLGGNGTVKELFEDLQNVKINIVKE